jgi:hypothetical protein
MSLEEAIMHLCRIHTDDDEVTGFNVKMGATPGVFDMGTADYVKAWETLRAHIHLRTSKDGSRSRR